MFRRIWPLVVATFSLGIDAYVLAGLLPYIAESLSTTPGIVGLGVAAFTCAYALSSIFLSRRAGERSARQGILLALAIFNMGNFVTAVSMRIEIFILARILAGIGAGILTALAASTAARMVEPEYRGRAMSMVTFGLSVGTVAGVPTGMMIGDYFGWRWAIALIITVGLIAMAAIFFQNNEMASASIESHSTFEVLKISQVRLGVVLAFMLGMTSLGLYTYMIPMASVRGLESWGFLLIWSWGIGGVVGSMAVGKRIDRIGSHRLLSILSLGLLGAFSLLMATSQGWLWLISVGVWGAAGWASVPTLQDVLTRARPRATTSIVAFQMAAMYLGSSAGSTIGSMLLEGGLNAGLLPLCALGVQVLAVIAVYNVSARSQKI